MNLKTLSQHPVFWVVISLSLVITPHLHRFPVWSIMLISGLFIWRLICIKKTNWLPDRWLLILLITLSCVAVFINFGSLFGKTTSTVLLSVLLAIKLQESRTTRDFMLLIALSFFIIVTNFLFTQSIPTVLFMLFAVIVLLMSLISINQANAAIAVKEKFKLSVKILAQAIPLMLILFVLFPRLPGPLWKLPEEQQATTGLSDTLSPGNISNLIQSNAIAFRVDFNDKIPAQNQLYWRALVLWYFDGQTWETGKLNTTTQSTITPLTPPVTYTITMQPNQQNWLYALDIPVEVSKPVSYTNNFELRADKKITSLFQYSLSSSLEYVIQVQLSAFEKSAGLKIPVNSNPQTIQLGQQLARQYQRNDDIINHVLNLFNQDNFHYTLSPPLTPGFDPVDLFLFSTKSGFCEHYASSFALLMRAAGIPARIIVGYQGGLTNPLNAVMTVRQSDAHAWTEVWLKNRGWVRIDPTAAIAPQRIETNLNAALDATESRPFHMQLTNSLFKDLMFYWDAIDNQWNQWVVGYDAKLQQQFLDLMLDKDTEFADIVLLLVSFFTLAIIVLALWILKPWHKQLLDPEVVIYNKFCRKLARQGIHKQSHEGPVDFAQRAIKQLPQQKNSILLITRLYTKLRYEALHSEKQLIQLRQLTRQFRPGGLVKN